MADTDSQSGESPSSSILSKLTAKMAEVLSKTSVPTQVTDMATAPIGIKLDGNNYALWSQVVEMYIAGKDKLGYINGDLPQPSPTDPTFRKWRTDNAIVKGWVINSMDPSLIGNFIRFPTAKMVWDAIATTYFDGSDVSQVYDLRRRVTRLKQASGSLEKYYNDLQGLWREIDFRRPNPMECQADIQRYNSMVQEERVYLFLDGLDDRLDGIRRDVLQLQPFPTVEQAYAHVRREAIRQAVMTGSIVEESPGAVLASKGMKGEAPTPSFIQGGKTNSISKTRIPSDGQKCSHCGGSKHTRETCFKLHGYPEWWHELQAKKKRDGGSGKGGQAEVVGQASVAENSPSLSLVPAKAHNATSCIILLGSNMEEAHSKWILDSGASDHMTYDERDFSQRSTPRRTSIANANGEICSVTGAGTVMLSSEMPLSNTLLVPSLSHKLLSVSQLTKELKCVVIIYPDVCFLQDILTQKIIGRGIEKGGLYYMEDLNVGRACQTTHQSKLTEEQIWLWHRRLGHPSFGYLKHVFPSLFSDISGLELKCETCILAKSHRTTYPLSLNKSTAPFTLIHSDVWGPSPKPTMHGYRWFVIFVDDCTRMTWLYLLRHKTEVFDIFQSFYKMVCTQYSMQPRVLRSDNGGEYVNSAS